MQITVNSIFDSSLDNRSGGRVAKGIRQVSYLFILVIFYSLDFKIKRLLKKKKVYFECI
jgi:hypothetical protein